MRCEFQCSCGGKGNKTIRNCIEKSGMFCKECTNKTKSIKTNATCLEKYGGISPFHSQIVRDKIKATNLQKYGFEHPQQSQIVRDKTNATCLEKYGAENPLQSQIVKDKIKATNVEKYGFEHPLTKNWVELLTTKSREDKATNITINNIPLIDCETPLRNMRCEFQCSCGGKGNKTIGNCIKKGGMFCKECTNKTKSIKIKEKCLERYGVEYASQSQEIKDKIKKTCLDRFGGISPAHSQIVRDKMKATCLEKYGTSNGHSQIVRDKMKATCLENYGVEFPLQSQIVKDKIKATCLQKYGVENTFQAQIFKDKMKATCLENYGVEFPLQSQIVKDKIKATCLEKYGVEFPLQSQIVKDKIKATCLQKYGVENTFQAQIFKDKMKATCLENYGVEFPLQSQIVKDKIKATCLQKYGVEYCSQNTEIFEKIMKNRFKRKPYTFKSGETIECQGYEPFTLKDLEDNYNYTYEDYMNEPKEEFWYDTNDGKKHRYHKGGDIPFLKENKLIEVKSSYTFYADFYVNLLKAQCVLEKGYDFEFWVYDNKKELSIIDSKFMTNKFIVNSELLEHFKSSRV